jgi:hypothetical protein
MKDKLSLIIVSFSLAVLSLAACSKGGAPTAPGAGGGAAPTETSAPMTPGTTAQTGGY